MEQLIEAQKEFRKADAVKAKTKPLAAGVTDNRAQR
jgi:hypothetical protein